MTEAPDTDKESTEERNLYKKNQEKNESQGEWLKELIEKSPQLIDKYLTNSKQIEDAKERRLTLISKHNRRLAYSLLIAVGVIIGIMALLTFLNKVSGDALLFLVGTITGYVLFMIQNLTIPMYDEGGESE
jgi:hypothetical protein